MMNGSTTPETPVPAHIVPNARLRKDSNQHHCFKPELEKIALPFARNEPFIEKDNRWAVYQDTATRIENTLRQDEMGNRCGE